MTPAVAFLKSIDPRSVFPKEASAFTPWLAEEKNIDVLGDAIGLRLQVQSREHKVGSFRADLLCQDVQTGDPVLIENQLEGSDHSHLGQLLTYAAGLEAVSIVWIATSFSEDHRAALNWLNQITDERFNFFAVELELWSIADSLPAPRLLVVVRPSGWNRSVRRGTRVALLPDPARRRLEYWQMFLSQLTLEDSGIRLPQPNTLGNIRFTLRGNDLWVTVFTTTEKGHRRVGVFLVGRTGDFERLKRERRSIEAELGEPLDWNPDEDGTSWRIAACRECDPEDRSDWADQHRWLSATLNGFIRVFRPREPPVKR